MKHLLLKAAISLGFLPFRIVSHLLNFLNSVDSAILTAFKLCALISGCLGAILAAVFQLRSARFEIKDLVEHFYLLASRFCEVIDI